MSFTPNLNLPQLKTKKITFNYGPGTLKPPFYVPAEAMPEGAVVKRNGSVANSIVMAGTGEGAVAIGFAMQGVYDVASLGEQFGQLAQWTFGNDTMQKLDGQTPIGILTGAGYAEVRNYAGTVAAEDPAYIGPSGTLVTTGHAWAVSNNKLPAVFEGAGTDGDVPVRIRFDFPLASRS